METEAEAELHLGGAVRCEREGDPPRGGMVAGGDDGHTRREATKGGRLDARPEYGGGDCSIACVLFASVNPRRRHFPVTWLDSCTLSVQKKELSEFKDKKEFI